MAKTQAIEVPDELMEGFDASIEQGDRFVYGVVQSHKPEVSRTQKQQLLAVGLFKFMSTLWATLDAGEKDDWRTAGAFTNLTNWQLFISDNAARLRNDLPTNQGVSDEWQVRAGFIELAGSANEIKLVQEHPLDYWVVRKMAGKPWKKELVLIREAMALPITLGLSYKADLTVDGGDPYARFRARVQSSYQGQDIFTDLDIDLTADTDWVTESDIISSVPGYLVGYVVSLHIHDYQGTLLFDNLIIEHSGQNWARDPRADEIDKVFEKAFALVRPFWVPEIVPTGAIFNSLYPPAL